MEKKERNIEVKGAWLKVFCPNARCLSEEEIIALPPEKKQAAEETGEKGLWLEVFCPDDACLADEEKINIPVKRAGDKEDRGFWLNLFCPEDRCVITEPTDIP